MNTKDQKSCIFYFHSWVIDPDQPRIPNASLKTRFRHYLNLEHTTSRLQALIRDFLWDRMDRVFFDNDDGTV